MENSGSAIRLVLRLVPPGACEQYEPCGPECHRTACSAMLPCEMRGLIIATRQISKQIRELKANLHRPCTGFRAPPYLPARSDSCEGVLDRLHVHYARHC